MGQHRHLTCVRSDGLSAVLRPLLDDRRIIAATLVDVGSGLILDGFTDVASLSDLELLGATHADLVRSAATVTRGELAELTIGTGDGRHHLLHAVPDPHGDRLVVAVVVDGGLRVVERARRRLRTVSVAALTAGPTLQKRPVNGRWFPEPTPATGPIPRADDEGRHDENRHASPPGDDTATSIPTAREPADAGPTPAPAPPAAMLPRVT